MMQRALRRSVGLVILLVWAGASSPAKLRAQNLPFKNPSLDSNCYFPQIGVPGEIDTIYGCCDQEGLGAVIHNLGTKADGSFGNMLIGNGSLSPYVDWNEAATGPGFNLHALKAKAQKLKIDPQYLRFGHFHNRTSVDLFDADWWRIYWADENGDYDSTRYTELTSNIYGRQKNGAHGLSRGDDVLSQPYLAHLTSDTVDDLVVGFGTFDTLQAMDSLYLALFKGGDKLASKGIAYEDTSILIAPVFPYIHQFSHYSMQGDFRGTGRDDLIIADESRNVFFFKNDPPFTLEKLLHAMLFDTLWTRSPRWNDVNANNQRVYWINPFETLAMHALPKKSGDHSYDWVVWIPTKDSGNTISIFRGGPDFGSHRISIDSAAFVITAPKLGELDWPVFFSNAGDMTGTGNTVLYVDADNGVDYAYQNFYLTGRALDQKIDIYNSFSAGADGDTMTANGDSLEDFLMGLNYTSDADMSKGKRLVGSIWLMYGSKQIPVHINPQWADVKTEIDEVPKRDGAGIIFAPNPVVNSWSVATIVWPEEEEAEYKVYDMLGRMVERGPLRMLGGAEQQRIYFSGLVPGTYLYTLTGSRHTASTRFVKLSASGAPAGPSSPSFMQSLRDARDGRMAPSATAPSLIR